MLISVVINCDTRPEKNEQTGLFGGVCNEDFLTDGVFNKIKFFDGFNIEIPVGKYFIDVGWVNLKIGIELDGLAYHSSAEQLIHDAFKDEFLQKRGWKIYRFFSSELWDPRIMAMNLKFLHPILRPGKPYAPILAELLDADPREGKGGG